MTEAVAVVTGATGGMGMEIVRDLANDHVVYAWGAMRKHWHNWRRSIMLCRLPLISSRIS